MSWSKGCRQRRLRIWSRLSGMGREDSSPRGRGRFGPSRVACYTRRSCRAPLPGGRPAAAPRDGGPRLASPALGRRSRRDRGPRSRSARRSGSRSSPPTARGRRLAADGVEVAADQRPDRRAAARRRPGQDVPPGGLRGILARRHRPDELESLPSRASGSIDIVVVNVKPFAPQVALAASCPSTRRSR